MGEEYTDILPIAARRRRRLSRRVSPDSRRERHVTLALRGRHEQADLAASDVFLQSSFSSFHPSLHRHPLLLTFA